MGLVLKWTSVVSGSLPRRAWIPLLQRERASSDASQTFAHPLPAQSLELPRRVIPHMGDTPACQDARPRSAQALRRSTPKY